ncbi:L-aspartate oxidase [Delftia tsuruhatensis]|uniref:L-aspartate oxidase n=1 Tax=Delftia tsuruhatensis TaxID=180282 RepID=UPI001E6DF619|nr:L-aspartate oxidase [Delftia tsuruhatensis]CAB5704309.1 L-aspartate oxidase [Delftia tsuruhatensis]CAC9689787.1 L-aspartate oxidase [Delftia tsuruhatensis]
MTQPSTDVLIIGAGLAGMATALSLPAHLRVSLLSKGAADECASAWAQGGIAAVLDAEDSLDAHVQDTLVAGAGQCDARAVRAILEQAPAAIEWLLAHGVPFTREADGRLHLTREGGHGRRRIVHAADATGQAVHAALLRACRARPNIALHEHTSALDLLTAGQPARCEGALVRMPDQTLRHWHAGRTVLATGGMGQVYPCTTNPATATGDGLAMAWRAGCRVGDLEFMQFHPTALQVDGRAAGLVSEALRGEGALLRLPDGTRFMPLHDARAELAPRDIVARAIWHEMARHGLAFVHLDISHRPRPWLQAHFPAIMALCAAHGIDIATQPIPVAPCAHYACGGVLAGIDGRTDLQDLHAIGEVARTGLHGANRLASNSLLECVVMGRAAARAIAQQPAAVQAPAHVAGPMGSSLQAVDTAAVEQQLRQLMHDCVGIQRSDQGLAHALQRIAAWRQALEPAAGHALRNQLDVCWLMASAAAARRESCGAHSRIDAAPALVE